MRTLADKVGELVICGDGQKGYVLAEKYGDSRCRVSAGLFEKGWQTVLSMAKNDWILQLDDDEEVSPALEEWLVRGDWQKQNFDGYAFPTAWLFGDKEHYIINNPLGKDYHVRLAKKEYSQREEKPHARTQEGRMVIVPYMILHHKFLIKGIAKRVEIARKYEKMLKNGGLGLRLCYNVPEVVYPDIYIADVKDGKISGRELGNYIR